MGCGLGVGDGCASRNRFYRTWMRMFSLGILLFLRGL